MTSWTSVTTMGMMVNGMPMHVASAIMPAFITCASIWPKPAISLARPAPSGTRMPAGRIIVLTTSPGRSVNCWTVPATPARTRVLSSSTCACLSAASALAFWAGRSEDDLCLDGPFVGDGGVERTLAAVGGDLQPLDLPNRDVRIAPQELLPGCQFVQRLLVRALRLLDEPVRGGQLRLRHGGLGNGFVDLALCRLVRCLLFGTVEPKERVACLDLGIDADEHFGNTADGLGQNGDGAEYRGDVLRRRVIIKHQGDQRNGQQQARRDAPAQFIPNRIKIDLASDALALDVTAIEIVRERP